MSEMSHCFGATAMAMMSFTGKIRTREWAQGLCVGASWGLGVIGRSQLPTLSSA
jgi:hypothetical protein